jgi:hypothetical protein
VLKKTTLKISIFKKASCKKINDMMLKKYFFLLVLYAYSTTLFAQLSCPNFKIRGNKSPRSTPAYTTAIKFQLDGIAQYQGIAPQSPSRVGVYPAFSLGVEQSIFRKFSVSANHGWTFNPRIENKRFIFGDVRFYFDKCFQKDWLSARVTLADASKSIDDKGLQSMISFHYGNTASFRRVFTHYEMGIGFGQREVIVFSLGAATGLKL